MEKATDEWASAARRPSPPMDIGILACAQASSASGGVSQVPKNDFVCGENF